MLELELIDIATIDQLMDVCERLLHHCIDKILTSHQTELESINAVSKCQKMLNEFVRIEYRSCCVLGFTQYEHDEQALLAIGVPPASHSSFIMNKSAEKVIVEKCGNGAPVFVTKYPIDQKPFYMKTDSNGRAECFDLLAGDSGEIAGGSVRQDGEMNIPDGNNIKWYVDLRKCGYPALGGFGIGIERLLMAMLGLSSVKESLPFPRFKDNCQL